MDGKNLGGFMRRFRSLLLVACCCAGVNGCLAQQVAADGINLRQALVALYTDQAMDNLIRAAENRPFVQLAFSNLEVYDVTKASGSTGSNAADFTGGHAFTAAAVGAAKLTRTTGFTGSFPFGATGERDRQLSFRADPVTNQNNIYQAYLDFVHNPMWFVVSDARPDGPVHLCRKCGCKWYWIPLEAGPEFLELVMTTAINPSPAPAPIYWESTITTIVPQHDKNGQEVPYKWVITLSKEVPNDDGLMVITLKGSRVTLPIQRVDQMPIQAGKPAQQEGPGAGVPTKVLYAQFSDAVIPRAQVTGLIGAPVQFFARNYPNLNPRPSNDSQKIEDSLESIRLLLTKTSPLGP